MKSNGINWQVNPRRIALCQIDKTTLAHGLDEALTIEFLGLLFLAIKLN
jgi:hypothetical protein